MIGRAFLALMVALVSAADEAAEGSLYAPAAGLMHAVFVETFQGESHKFVESDADRYAGQSVSVGTGTLVPGIPGDKALVLNEKAKHYGLMATFDKAVDNMGKDFVLQYEVRLHEGLDCGGAYLKVIDEAQTPAPAELTNESPYIIMFGPDRCGQTNKVHFIMRHQNPVSKEWEEKHFSNPPSVTIDDKSHLYTLIIRSDNSFSILIDSEEKSKGSLLEDMSPPVNPPGEIDDPEDNKPEDWVDNAKIVDPDASKPDDWDEDAPKKIVDEEAEMPDDWLVDEPLEVPDPEAEMPEDWDPEEDGDWEAPIVTNPRCEFISGCGKWEAPMIDNPAFKGKWSAPMIDNPDYIGVWKPKQITNPNFFKDESPSNLAPMGAVAIEIWTMSGGIAFDNVLVTHDVDGAADFAEETFKVKQDLEVTAKAKKAKAERKADREKLLEDGSLSGKLQYGIGETLDRAGENPVVAGIIIVGLVFLLVFAASRCCCGEEDEDEPQFGLADSDSVPNKEKMVNGEAVPKEEQESEKPVEKVVPSLKKEAKTTLRKRPKKKTPKADD